MRRTLFIFISAVVVSGYPLVADPGQVRHFPVGVDPWYLAIGDFNEDSHLDVVTANSGDNSIAVLLGNGYGGFPDSAEFYDAGNAPRVVEIGDFNADGHQDLIVLNSGENSNDLNPDVDQISFYYGDGTGWFSGPWDMAVGDYPAGVTVGDFNEDTFQDLAITNYVSHNVMILRGRGNGSFALDNTISTGGGPRSLVVGDFNEDGHQDLAVGLRTASTLIILEGDGSGMFTISETSYEVNEFPRQIVAVDLNEDGHEDIAAACRGNSKVGILFGDGTGLFSPTIYYNVGGYPRSIAAVDLDDDGRVDLATGNFESDDVSFIMNDGEGRVIKWMDKHVGTAPRMLTAGDFDEDGYTDLAVVNSGPDELVLLLGTAKFILPELISPADSSWTPVDPIFKWDAVPGAKYFQIFLNDTLNTFTWSKIIHDETSAVYDGTVPLVGGRVYQWSIRQSTGGTFWDYTDSRIFFRFDIQSPIDAPVLKTPYNDDVILPDIFSWYDVVGARRYAVNIYPDTTSTDTVWGGYAVSELITVPDIMDSAMVDSTLYWAVTPYDSSGNHGPTSERNPFTLRVSMPVPDAPLLLEPLEVDTLDQSPVTMTWSWPAGASLFTLNFSIDETFPSDPTKTWVLEEVTDSTLSVDLPAGSNTIFWNVTARNGAGESLPSTTNSFTYLVTDTIPIASVQLLMPEEGSEYPLGKDISSIVLIRGDYTGPVSGYWELDGDSLFSFTADMVDTAGLKIISTPFGPDEEGRHFLMVVIVEPDTVVSDSVNFIVNPTTAGSPEAILLSADPMAIPADGVSTSLLEVFVVDEEGEVVLSDSGRLIAFLAVGEAEFKDSSHVYTLNGKASITLTSTTEPDSEVLVFAVSDSLETGIAILQTFEGDLSGDLTALQAHVDRLSALNLEIYDPPYNLPLESFDHTAVNDFLQERIIGVPDPDEADKSAMRRLLYLERALNHGYHHEFDMSFPDPSIVTGEGTLRASDDIALLTWDVSLLTVEALKASHHLISKTKGDSALIYSLGAKTRRDVLSFLRDFYTSIIEQLGVIPGRERLIRTHTNSMKYSFTALDTVPDPRDLIENSAAVSGLTLHIAEGVIKDAQSNLDTAAVRAFQHYFTGSDSTTARLVGELVEIIDALTFTAHNDFNYYRGSTDTELPLENFSHIRSFYDQSIISRNDYSTFKNCLESAFAPKLWSSLRNVADISMTSLLETGYGLVPLSLELTFGDSGYAVSGSREDIQDALIRMRQKMATPQDAGGAAAASLWQNLLDMMMSRASNYESTARELMEAISEVDTLVLEDLFAELIILDDSLSVGMDKAIVPAGAVYPYGVSGIAGFEANYTELKELLTSARFNRLMFILSTYDYILVPARYISGIIAIDWGSKAIDSIRLYREALIDLITDLFNSQAYPLVFTEVMISPDTVTVNRSDLVKLSLTNLGAGTARDVYVKLYPGAGVSTFRGDSVWVGDIETGASIEAEFRIKAKRFDFPEVVELGTVVMIPYCSNGIGYPGFSSVTLHDAGGFGWDVGPPVVIPADSIARVAIHQPVGGELMAGESEFEITWVTYGPTIDHLSIVLSQDAGATYPDTVTAYTEDDSSYMWTVPLINTTTAKIRLVAFSEDSVELASVDSPDTFTVDSTPPEVDIINPDGRDTLYVGEEYDIEWITDDPFPLPETAVVRSSRSHGDGKLHPTPERSFISVKRVTRNRSKITDDKRNSARTVLKERTGRMMLAGAPNTVSIFYSTDSGQSWKIIALEEPDDSIYTWTVPNAQSVNCRVAVEAVDGAGNHGNDMSKEDFMITSAPGAPGSLSGKKERRDKIMSRGRLDDRGRRVSARGYLEEGDTASNQALSGEVGEVIQDVPVEFGLFQNTPNPFNPSTSISFAVPGDVQVEIDLIIYDLRGRRITTLASGLFSPGQHSITWHGRDSRGLESGSGVYLYILKIGDNIARRKMTLIR